jgi:phosphoglycolate phosphatase
MERVRGEVVQCALVWEEVPLRFSAALFDMDGTLLDTLEDIADATNGALREMGFPEKPLPDYRYAVGDGMEMLIRRVLPEGAGEEATVHRCLARMRELYRSCWAAKTLPYDGIPQLLQALEARGVSLAILSNKPQEFTSRMAAHFFPKVPFRDVRGARPGVLRKPDPAAALAVAETIGMEPARIFYLGDTATDMETALAAGMFPTGALWGFRPEAELREAGAKALLTHPSEALNYF